MTTLGQGAMGTVYRARDPGLDREVALKVVAPDLVRDQEALERFQREARAAARLQHHNIVTIYELGHDGGVHYIAMELLEGMDLHEAMAPGRLPLDRKLRFVADVCRGLDFAHRRGVVHRDVKPANVRVLESGAVKIVDFGVAHLAGSQLTRSGVVLGTPTYLPPEILTGAPVDHRSDMWSVGIILYEMAAGHPPFEAATFATLARSIVGDPLPPLDAPDLPPGLAALVERALAKAPDRRFARMAEMADALEAVLVRGDEAPPTQATLVHSEPTRAAEAVPAASRPRAVPASAATPTAAALLREHGPQAYAEIACFGEPPAVHTAAPTDDGTLLALASTDGALRVVDHGRRRSVASLRTEMHRRAGHEARALEVAFAPNGRLLASAHLDGSVRLWDLQAEAELPVRMRHDSVSSVAFSPSGRTLASAGMDAAVKLWDVAAALAGDPRRQLHRQPAGVSALAYAAGFLATGHSHGLVRLHDSATLRLVATVRGPRALVTVLAPSPDGRTLAVASQDHTVRLLDLAASPPAVLWSASPYRRPVTSLAFLSCGTVLATAAADGVIHFLETASGDVLASLWSGPDEVVVGVAAQPALGLAAALADGRVRLWAPAG